jgi:hypothetical protein
MMPELPDDDPRFEEFHHNLTRAMRVFIGKQLDRVTVMQIHDVVLGHRINFKNTYGYDAPAIVALVLPTSQYIGLYRADLETRDIQIVILNLLREFAVRRVKVDKKELAWALNMAWPNYDPAIEFFAADGQAKRVFLN